MKIRIFVFPVVIGIILIFFFTSAIFFQMTNIGSSGLTSPENNLPKIILENLNKKYHLDLPLYERYLGFLKQSLIHALGPSYQYSNWTINQLIAMRAPMSGLFMVVSGVMILVSVFLRVKKPRNTLVSLFLICALILLSVINMYFIYYHTVKAVIAMLVFAGCLLFIVFRRDGKILNYASCVLVILSLFQLFVFENILKIKGISSYLIRAALDRDYSFFWDVQYSLFLLATLTGVLVSYIGVYLNKER